MNQEISTAKAAGKLIIPVVQRGMPLAGYLTPDIEYIELDFFNPRTAVEQLLDRLDQLATAQRQSQEARRGAWVIGGLIGAGLLLFGESDE